MTLALTLCTGIVIGFFLGVAAVFIAACWAFKKAAIG